LLEFAVQNVGRNIFWRFHVAQEISAPAVRPNAPSFLLKNLPLRSLPPVPHHHWTFSIPRVLPGLFERERALMGLLSQTAYASILKSFQALLDRTDARPGCVISLPSFGAYGANFNPHCHALVSDGAFTPGRTPYRVLHE
jgi:hypothetical protein